MKVAVASKNPVKIAAAKHAFELAMPGVEFVVTGLSVASGVSEQPKSDAETRTGACNRAANAAALMPDADFSVGMEGGIEVVGDQLMAFAWMVVQAGAGPSSAARTVSLPLPPAVRDLIDAGLELGDANDRVFATVNSKQGGGAYGLLTGGRYTRESVYEQALVIALIPFVNALYPDH